MQEKMKNIVVTVVFLLFILSFSALCIPAFFNPVLHSDAENRDLAQFPEKITWEGVIDKTVINAFEKASVDQFPFREFFRSFKAKIQYNVLGLKENNGYVEKDGYICQIKNEFNAAGVQDSLGKLGDLYNTQIAGNASNVYVSLIPDKNYYLGKDYGYPAPNFDKLAEQYRDVFPESTYSDITGALKLESFYKTDTHWDQSQILGVVETLGGAMGFEVPKEYTQNTIEGFEGIYFDQSAMNPDAETLTYLTNEIIDNLKVQDVSNNQFLNVYAPNLFNEVHNFEIDGYNVFLSGKAGYPVLRIINPKATENKVLVVFRDSYGSSIAPLLAQGYKMIYVVDLRSIDYELLGQQTVNGARNPYYIDFSNKDVLFLLSGLVIDSGSFK